MQVGWPTWPQDSTHLEHYVRMQCLPARPNDCWSALCVPRRPMITFCAFKTFRQTTNVSQNFASASIGLETISGRLCKGLMLQLKPRTYDDEMHSQPLPRIPHHEPHSLHVTLRPLTLNLSGLGLGLGFRENPKP